MVSKAAPSSSPTVRPAWWLVLCGLVGYICLSFVLPAFDPRAAEFTPRHGHLVLGSATSADADRALAGHNHNTRQPHPHSLTEATVSAQAGDVGIANTPTVIGTSGIEVLSHLASLAYELLDLAISPLAQSPLALWMVMTPAALLLTLCMLPPLKHPPRRLPFPLLPASLA